MPDITEQRKLAAIMFTDMVGHSADLRVWAVSKRSCPTSLHIPESRAHWFSQQFRQFIAKRQAEAGPPSL